MGWAKYLEDIASRRNGASRVHAEFPQVAERWAPPNTAAKKTGDKAMSKLKGAASRRQRGKNDE